MSDSVKMRVPVLAFIAAVLCCWQPVQAGGGEEFLSRLAGEWRGRGTARFPGRPAPERVTCRIENHWNAAERTLAVTGQCASSQGKGPVAGKLELAGGAVNGMFLGEFEGVTPTKSSGTVAPGQLVVTTSFVNNATGALSQARQVIHLSGTGFTAEFFLFDNKSQEFKKSGDMVFSGS